jgi:hypothetical protein
MTATLLIIYSLTLITCKFVHLGMFAFLAFYSTQPLHKYPRREPTSQLELDQPISPNVLDLRRKNAKEKKAGRRRRVRRSPRLNYFITR